jgi:hypothetical protein
LTVAEKITRLENELAEVQAAKTRIYSIGQSSDVGTGKSSRRFDEAQLEALNKREKEIIAELDNLDNGSAVVLGASW